MKGLSKDLKNTLKSLRLLSIFILIVFTVNILVDPANIATDSYAESAAQILVSGKHVTNLENFDDRDFVKCYAKMREEQVDVLALGSSRSMQITKELTNEENTFCAGVTGADLRDCISAYMIFKENGHIPEKVILCAEYWFLSAGNLDARALTDEYYKFCRNIGSTPHKTTDQWMTEMKELFSFSYFQSSINYLLSDNKMPDLAATDIPDNRYPTRRVDGSYSYEQSYRTRRQSDVDSDAEESTRYNSLARSFSGVDSDLQYQFEAFIEMMQRDNVEVILQLSPFHPIYYTHMTQNADFNEILRTEKYFYSLEDKLGISCYGGYNPADFDMDNTDFYDAQHPTAEGIYKYYMTKHK